MPKYNIGGEIAEAIADIYRTRYDTDSFLQNFAHIYADLANELEKFVALARSMNLRVTLDLFVFNMATNKRGELVFLDPCWVQEG